MPSPLGGRELWLKAIFGDDHGPAVPDPFYLALVTEPPGDLDDGGDLLEPDTGIYTTYARAEVDNDDANWGLATLEDADHGTVVVYNLDTVTFPSCGASAGVTVRAVVVTDSPTGGEVVVWSLLGSDMEVGAASLTPRFDIQSLYFGLENPPTSLPSGG